MDRSEGMNYWIKNVLIETGYETQGGWIGSTQTKAVAIEVKEARFSQIVDLADFDEALASEVVDGGGQLLLPALIEKHCHLDKSKMGTPWQAITPAATIVERFESEIPSLDRLSVPLRERARKLMDLELPHGVVTFRSHVDVEPMTGLRHFDEVSAFVDSTGVDTELVVFPQHGLRLWAAWTRIPWMAITAALWLKHFA